MSATPRAAEYRQHQDNSIVAPVGEDGLESRLIGGNAESSLGGRSSSNRGGRKSSVPKSFLHDPDSLLHTVFNIACHVVYPVITAPFFIGIFYIFAALRLAVPSMGWCSNKFTFTPGRNSHWSSSTLFILTGGLYRACPSATRNGDYAVIIFIIGLSLLFSLSAPLYNIAVTNPGVSTSISGEPSIVIATFVGYVVSVYVFLWIGLKFSIYARAEKTRERLLRRDPRVAGQQQAAQQKSVSLNAQREALSFLADIDGLSVSFSPLWTLAVGITASVIECVLYKVYHGAEDQMTARFDNLENEWSALTFATFFFLLASTNIVCWFGLYLLYEQQHHLSVFARERKLNATSSGSANDAQIAKWAVSWQYLLQEMERAPMVCSIAPACSMLLFVEAAASLVFGVIYNLFYTRDTTAGTSLGSVLPIFVFLGTHSGVLLVGYLWVIVHTQNVIEHQHKAISALQNSMQLQVDAAALDSDDQLLPSLRAKVRVLQSLDRFLVIADPKPKILGTSVDSFRWAMINFSLIVINVTFLALYIFFCYNSDNPASPQPPTNSTMMNTTTTSTTTTTMMPFTSTTKP